MNRYNKNNPIVAKTTIGLFLNSQTLHYSV